MRVKKEFCKVELDLSEGSAYKYKKDSKVPTKITYGRMHSGKYQKGKLEGEFSHTKLHDLVYAIKRGWTTEEINVQLNADY